MMYKQSSFEKWLPPVAVDSVYDIDNIAWKENGLNFTLIPDDIDHKKRSQHRLEVVWSDILSYQVTRETYREDCWINDPQQAWTFFVSDTSAFIDALRKESALCPEKVLHFMLVGTNWVVDVLAENYPTVKVMEKCTLFNYQAESYQVEIDRAATLNWYASHDEWGCECGDCRNYVSLAKQRALTAYLMETLDSLGIPLEKATYVSELYTDEEGVHYQVSYRVAGNVLAAPIEEVKNAFGRCCHEIYPYGAPDFTQPHFDIEFYPTLPWVMEE